MYQKLSSNHRDSGDLSIFRSEIGPECTTHPTELLVRLDKLVHIDNAAASYKPGDAGYIL